MNQETEHPILVIESPNGTVLRLYQPVSDEYLKQLIDTFLVEKKLLVKA